MARVILIRAMAVRRSTRWVTMNDAMPSSPSFSARATRSAGVIAAKRNDRCRETSPATLLGMSVSIREGDAKSIDPVPVMRAQKSFWDIVFAMPSIRFTRNIQRHVVCPTQEVAGTTLREVFDQYFRLNAAARGYVLDDGGKLRKHMAAFIDGQQIGDRDQLSDPVPPTAIVDIVQSLSGG